MIEFNQQSSEAQANDRKWMELALAEARLAGDLGEVPIGAVIVLDGKIIGRGHNVRELAHDALGHAEIQAIQAANQAQASWRLEGATIYVTLEPCPMCSGALINARIAKVVYGASDLKAGCCGTLMNLVEDSRFNHRLEVVRGACVEESAALLSQFFQDLRLSKKNRPKS